MSINLKLKKNDCLKTVRFTLLLFQISLKKPLLEFDSVELYTVKSTRKEVKVIAKPHIPLIDLQTGSAEQ